MTRRLTLVDTSAFIEADRHPGSDVAAAVVDAVTDGRAATCSVVVAELLTGCRGLAEYRKMQRALGALAWLPLTDECWTRAAALGFNLRRAGITVPLTDRLIVVIARLHEADVLHCDTHLDLVRETPDEIQ